MATNRYEGNTGRYIRLPDAYSESEYPPRPRMRPGRFPEPEREREAQTEPEPEKNSSREPGPQDGESAPGGRPETGRGPENPGSRNQNAYHDGGNRPNRQPPRPASPQHAARHGERRGALESLLSGLGGGLSSRLGNLETEDLLLLAIVYLMYRESGDKQLLVVLAALLFF